MYRLFDLDAGYIKKYKNIIEKINEKLIILIKNIHDVMMLHD